MKPNSILGRLTFWRSKATSWTGIESQIGLSPTETLTLADLLDAAESASEAQATAIARAQAATADLHAKLGALDGYGSILISEIKAAALTDRSIYPKAHIPSPKTRERAGLPPVPTGVSASINTDGKVQLRWKGSTRHRTAFQISRQLLGEQGWTVVGASATKKFVDNTLPIGARSASYKVVAFRSAGSSTGSQATSVIFGSVARAA